MVLSCCGGKMTFLEQIYLLAALVLAVVIGLEGWIGERRSVVVGHVLTVAAAYVGVALNSVLAAAGAGVPESALGPTAALCLIAFGGAEWLAGHSPSRRSALIGRASYATTLALGVGCATQEAGVLVCGFIQMLTLFIGRSEFAGAPVENTEYAAAPVAAALDARAMAQ